MALKEREEILVLEACLALKVNPDVGLLIYTFRDVKLSTETVPDRLLMLDSTWLHSCNLRPPGAETAHDELQFHSSR